MSAKDKFHDSVKNALIKDGWTIAADPLQIKLGDIDAYIDLGAEKLLTAEKDGDKIAIEIKSFLGASNISLLSGLKIARRKNKDKLPAKYAE